MCCWHSYLKCLFIDNLKGSRCWKSCSIQSHALTLYMCFICPYLSPKFDLKKKGIFEKKKISGETLKRTKKFTIADIYPEALWYTNNRDNYVVNYVSVYAFLDLDCAWVRLAVLVDFPLSCLSSLSSLMALSSFLLASLSSSSLSFNLTCDNSFINQITVIHSKSDIQKRA